MELAALLAAITAISRAIFLMTVISTIIVIAWMMWRLDQP